MRADRTSRHTLVRLHRRRARTQSAEGTSTGWFLNQHEDTTTGLGCLNNRYHDPTLGIFISVDPLVTTTFEPYIYGAANPITYSDPTGLCPMNSAAAAECAARYYNQRLGSVQAPRDSYNRESRMTERANHVCSSDFWRCARSPEFDAFTRATLRAVDVGLLVIEGGQVSSTVAGLSPGWVWTEDGERVTVDVYLEPSPSDGVPRALIAGTTLVSGLSCPATGVGCAVAFWSGSVSAAMSANDLANCVQQGCSGLQAAGAGLDIVTFGAGELVGRALGAAVGSGQITSGVADVISAQVWGMTTVVNSVGFVGANFATRDGSLVLSSSFRMRYG